MLRTIIATSATLALLAAACGDDNASDLDAATERVASGFVGPNSIRETPPAVDVPFETEVVVELDEDQEAVAVVMHPHQRVELLVVDRRGRVFEIVDGERTEEPWIDLTDRVDAATNFERGLLGLALDDRYAYLYFTDLDGDSNLVAYELDTEGRPVLPSERLVLHVEQPGVPHNAGSLQLTSDGRLWVALGDGGSGSPRWNAQDPTSLLGTIIRIEPTPDADEPYAIPEDNPFVGDAAALPEIYVYGLRNPWGFWVDETTGDLWIADVGEADYEEVNVVRSEQAGANLGWPWREGYSVHEEGFDGSEPLHDPLLDYSHAALGCAIIGGGIVRDGAPELEGAYLFGDLCSRHVVAVHPTDDGQSRPRIERVARTDNELTGIAILDDGSVLLTTRKPGALVSLDVPGS